MTDDAPKGTAGAGGARAHTLMIVENLPVPPDRRVWQEACALRDAGIDVTVICPKGRGYDAADESIDGIRILRHDLPLEASGAAAFLVEYGAALWHEIRLAWRVWRSRRFDVVHVANPPDLLFLVALPFKPFGVKLVFDHHDLTPELYREKFGTRGLGYWLMRASERLSFLFADVVISTNESYQRIARDRGRKRDDDVFIVRSAPDSDVMRPVEPDPAIRAKAATIIGYVGIMGSQDGIDVLLDAAHRLVRVQKVPDVHFVLVGDGPERPRAEDTARRLGLADAVTFAGYQTGERLRRTLSSIDIGICPDPCNDYTTRCTMNKVMEYMAFAKPLVQFDLIEGRASAAGAALYARPGDVDDLVAQLRRLVEDPALRAELGAIGRRRMETVLHWRHEEARLRAAYDRVLGRAPTA